MPIDRWSNHITLGYVLFLNGNVYVSDQIQVCPHDGLNVKGEQIIIKEITDGFSNIRKEVQALLEKTEHVKNSGSTMELLAKKISQRRGFGENMFFSKNENDLLKFISENKLTAFNIKKAIKNQLTFIN